MTRTPKRAADGLAPTGPAAQPGSAAPAEPGAGALSPPSGAPAQSSPPPRRSVPRRAAAGLDRETGPHPARNPSPPDPVTGAASSTLLGAAPGRGRAQAPAGGAPSASADGSSAPLAGSTGRTYTIALPPGLKLLSLNDRGHWAARYRRSQALKKAAWAMALQAKIPRLGRVSVVAEYQPPDRRHRDADNPVASVKAAIDGIVAAGVLAGDDSPRYIESVTCRIGETYPKGRLVLYLTEIAATGDEAA